MEEQINNIIESFHRDYRLGDYEFWTANDSSSIARCSNDRVILKFATDTTKVVTLFTNSKNHIGNNDLYESIVRLFKNLIQDEGSFEFQQFYLADASDYYPAELISLTEVLKCDIWDEEIRLASVRRTIVTSTYEHWRFLWNNHSGYHSEDHVVIEKQTVGAKATIFTAQPLKVTSSAFIDQLCGLLNSFESYSVHFVLCSDPFDLSVDEEIEKSVFSKMLFSKNQECID